MAKKGFVPVGRIIKAHGLKGELCIKNYADSPFFLEEIERVYLKAEGRRPQRHGLVQVRHHSKGLLLTLEHISGRDTARQWLGAEVWVRPRDVPKSLTESVRLLELLGASVYLEDDRFLGSIESVDQRSGQEVWAIRTPKDREVLLPAVSEFIRTMDREGHRVVIDPPPGLLELYGVTDEE
ncbi:MAG: ribosome maturation factor RimM [Desulfovermiculus sp.]|nr:ribosome maturation factor RimM [Desulfovermiculus sp.]